MPVKPSISQMIQAWAQVEVMAALGPQGWGCAHNRAGAASKPKSSASSLEWVVITQNFDIKWNQIVAPNSFFIYLHPQGLLGLVYGLRPGGGIGRHAGLKIL